MMPLLALHPIFHYESLFQKLHYRAPIGAIGDVDFALLTEQERRYTKAHECPALDQVLAYLSTPVLLSNLPGKQARRDSQSNQRRLIPLSANPTTNLMALELLGRYHFM
jgi:hypothetical protein